MEVLKLFYITIFIKLGLSRKYITYLVVPDRVDPRRESAILSCYYTLDSEGLFSVKWFKDDEEFYRFMPSYQPQIMSFDVHGITLYDKHKVSNESGYFQDVDDCSLNSCTIRLINLKPSSAGSYSCEVSTEAPTFNMEIQTKNMTILVPPSKDPTIEGTSLEYKPGDIIYAFCISDLSYPPTLITWYINNEVPPANAILSVPGTSDRSGYLTRSTSYISVEAERSLFTNRGEALNIKCETSLPDTEIARDADLDVFLMYDYLLNDSNDILQWRSDSGGVSKESNLNAVHHILIYIIIACFKNIY